MRRTLADAQGGVERARVANPPLPDGRGHHRAGPQPAAARRLRDPLCAGLRHRDGTTALGAVQYVSHRFGGYAARAGGHCLVALSRLRAGDFGAAGPRQRLAPTRGTYGIPPLRRTPAGSAHGLRVPPPGRHPLPPQSHLPFPRSASSGGHHDRVFQPPQRLPRTPVDHLGAHRRRRRLGHPHLSVAPSSVGPSAGIGHVRDSASYASAVPPVQTLRPGFGHRHCAGVATLRGAPVVPAPGRPRRRLVHPCRNAAPQMDAVWKSIILYFCRFKKPKPLCPYSVSSSPSSSLPSPSSTAGAGPSS